MKHWRVNLFLVVVIALAATLGGRLFYLQVWSHKFYQSQALGQQSQFATIQGSRGEIFLENSKESKGAENRGQAMGVAINEDKWVVAAMSKEIQDKNIFAASLAPVIDQTKESIQAQLESQSYVVLKKEANAVEKIALQKLKLKGLTFENKSSRFYPQKKLAAQVVGFVGGEKKGQYGLEGYYDELLTGKDGIREEKRGLEVIDTEDLSYLDGSDLYLTIDYNIQSQAEQLLHQAFVDFSIESGQIIVLKPDSGRIIAMANFPEFDPNAYGKENDLEIFQNATVQKIFEPGSIFKPFTMAMALHEGKVTPQTTFTDTGSVKIGPDTVYNFDRQKYGTQTLSGILEKSLNTGAVFLSQFIPHQIFMEYLDKLGFLDKTTIDVQGEVYSRNEILRKGSDFGFATASFGQGIEMTPLQLARAFAIFANGGRIVTPYIVDRVVRGQEKLVTKPKISDPIISEKTASEVTTMLTNVVERGFGKSAKVHGYYLAGKTGTAQVPLKNGKGYYEDKTIQSFVGFGPSLKPQFLILVKLDNPAVSASAVSAAPIFGKLAKYIIDYWQIPPDY